MKHILIIIISFCFLASCSRKRMNFKNKTYHKVTAYYNTIFNGEVSLEQFLESTRQSYVDDYDKILNPVRLPRFESKDDKPEKPREFLKQTTQENSNRGGAPGFGGNGIGSIGGGGNNEISLDDFSQLLSGGGTAGLDRSIEKAKKAIENHAMFSVAKSKENNSSMTAAYLLLGKARYYKGETFPAIDAFDYIISYLPKKSKHYNDAFLYQALANEQAGNDIGAEVIYEKLLKKSKLKRRLRKQICIYFADFLIRTKNYKKAYILLDKAIKLSNLRTEKARYTYIQAQLLVKDRQIGDGKKKFKKVIKYRPGFGMEVKALLAIADTYNPKTHSYKNYKNNLMVNSRKGTYRKYKNELFYGIGKLSINDDKRDEAKKYLEKSIALVESDPNIRGLAFGLLGDLSFDKFDYIEASAYYDSALVKITKKKPKERYTKLKESLIDVKKNFYLLEKNDSILNLTNMSEEERKSFFDLHIKELQKKEEEEKKELRKRERKAWRGDSDIVKTNNALLGQTSTKSNSFYFFNANAVDNGKRKFDELWGDRYLQDNWRLTNTLAKPLKKTIEEEKDSLLGKTEQKNPRRFDADFYIEKIPSDKGEIIELKLARDSAQLFLGKTYYDRFKNAPLAIKTLKDLISTPPALIPVERAAVFMLYQISKKEGLGGVENYEKQILELYSDSKYARYIENQSGDKSNSTKEALTFYDETYFAYKNKDYERVKANYQKALLVFKGEAIMERFTLINAFAIGATENTTSFKVALENILVIFPDTNVSERAQELLNFIKNLKATK